MGQYYYAIIKDTKNNKFIIGDPHHFNEGLKLMENGYVDSTFTKIVFSMIRNNPMRIAWVGDYAKKDDLKKFGTDENLVDEFIYAGYDDKNISDDQWLERNYPGSRVMGWFGESLVINHTKKEFFSQDEYWKRNFRFSNPRAEFAIDPLVALIAIGNGKGGGDFWGIGEDEVGRWATDEIEITSEIGAETLAKDGYKQIYPKFIEGKE